MKFTKILKTFALSSLFLTTIHATQASLPGLTFETNHPYANNLDVTKDLHIVSFVPIKSSVVTIQGELEKDNDFLIVTDNDGKVSNYTGVINESFTVKGNGVTVRLITNDTITEKGIIVNVTAQTDRPEVEPTDIFETNHPYANNLDITKKLYNKSRIAIKKSIVTIQGELEKENDFLIVTDEAGKEHNYTGLLHESLFVKGDTVKVRLITNDTITEKGVIVKLTPQIDDPEVEPTDIFKTGNPYKNNEDITQKLSFISILPIKNLMVTIKGEVEEEKDFIIIHDETGSEKKFTGILDEKFILNNTSTIKVNFTSNDSVTKEGAVVKIYPIDR